MTKEYMEIQEAELYKLIEDSGLKKALADQGYIVVKKSTVDSYVEVNADLAMRLSYSKQIHQEWLDSPAGALAEQNMELREQLKDLRSECEKAK